MTITDEQLELLTYALADAEKFWRHKRREVAAGQCDLYSESECTSKMKSYRLLFNNLSR